MATYKPSTESVLQRAKEVRDFLDSQQYADLIGTNDISSENSPFKTGDQTYSDGIALLDIVINTLISNSPTLDKIDAGMRSNFQSYLDNIFSWLTSNPTGNWATILQYSSTMYQWIHQWGLASNEAIDERILEKFKNLKITNEEVSQIQKLNNELRTVKDASDKLERASDIIAFVKKTDKVEEVANYVEGAEKKIDDLTSKAEELLGITSDVRMSQHFIGVSKQYQLEVYGNISIPKKYFLGFFIGLTTTFLVTLLAKYFLLRNFYLYEYSNFILIILSVIILITIIVMHYKPRNQNLAPSKTEGQQLKIRLGLIHYFLLSVLVVLPATLFYISKMERLDYQNEFLEVIANGLVRAAYLTPALLLIAFVSRNFLRKDKRRESYEFKSVAVKTIEGHILTLKNYAPDVLPEIVGKAISQIYEEPRDNFSEKENMNLETVNELLSMAEKVKSIGK